MRIIVTVNATRFSLDGIQYFKNYISKVAGSQIIIFNAYDRKDVLVDWTAFGDVQVNGITYGNVANLQSALLPVIYTRQSLGGGGGGGVESVTGNIVDNTDPANPIVNQDQDNLPIPIDLSLADLGLTEVGTDEEMNDALKDYFLANPLAVGEKQILDIRIFDAFPSAEPLLYLEFTNLTNLATDWGISDVNDVSEWNGYLGSGGYFNTTPDFENVEVVGNAVTLRGGTTNQTMTFFSGSFGAIEDWQLVECRIENFTSITDYSVTDTFSNPLLSIVNSTNIVQFGLTSNDSTIARFDSNFLDWATNEAPSDGNIDITGDGGEDLTLSDTYDVLVNTKNWTTP